MPPFFADRAERAQVGFSRKMRTRIRGAPHSRASSLRECTKKDGRHSCAAYLLMGSFAFGEYFCSQRP